MICAFICLCILFFVKKTKTDPIDTDYAAYYESIIESDAWRVGSDESSPTRFLLPGYTQIFPHPLQDFIFKRKHIAPRRWQLPVNFFCLGR